MLVAILTLSALKIEEFYILLCVITCGHTSFFRSWIHVGSGSILTMIRNIQ